MGSTATNTRTESDSGPTMKLEGHHEEVNCIAVSTDSSLLASGSEDCSVRIWDFGEGGSYKCIRELVGHTEYVICVAFVGNHLLSGSADMTLRKWNVNTGACELIISKQDGPVTQLVATPFLIFSSSSNALIHAWNFDSGSLVRDFSGHTGMIYGLHLTGFNAADNEGQLLAEGGVEEDETRPSTARAAAATASKRRLRLISYSDDCTAKYWAVTKGTCLQTFIGHSGPITCVAVDPNAHCLYTGSVDGTLRGEYLYTGSSDETARAWLTDIAQAVYTYKVITASGDGVVRVFDAAKANLLRQFKLSQEEKINCFKIVQNLIVVASQDGCLYGWELNRDEGT